jgi:hypothetical protein
VILEDDELNVPSVETTSMPTLAAVNISTVELKKLTDYLGPEARLDIESSPGVLGDCPLPALKRMAWLRLLSPRTSTSLLAH